MKRIRYIFISAVLSFLVVYLSVGIPVVQLRCFSCADAVEKDAVVAVVEVAEEVCRCGCADKAMPEHAGKQACCCCSTENVQDHSEAGSPSDSDCQNVKIAKINLPEAVSQFHFDQLSVPVMELFYSEPSALEWSAPSVSEERFDDLSPHRRPPRGYLNQLCTLLI